MPVGVGLPTIRIDGLTVGGTQRVSGRDDLLEIAELLLRGARAARRRPPPTSSSARATASRSACVSARSRSSSGRANAAGLRVFVGESTAIVSTADLSPRASPRSPRDACALARVTAPDRYAGLPDPDDLATRAAGSRPLRSGRRVARGRAPRWRWRARPRPPRSARPPRSPTPRARSSAAAADVSPTRPASAFAGSYPGSSFGLAVVPVARRERPDAARLLVHVGAPSRAARPARGRRPPRRRAGRCGGSARAGCRRPKSGGVRSRDGRVACCATSPAAISGTRALPAHVVPARPARRARSPRPRVTVVDDPLRPGGPASRPFDGEGVASRRRTVVRDGVLESYLLDSYSARRLGLRPTGHASRAVGDAPGVAPTNFLLLAGRARARGHHGVGAVRALRHRADRLRREPGHRRLLARRRRPVDRERRAGLPGRGDHHRRQPAGHPCRHRRWWAPTWCCATPPRPPPSRWNG